MVAGDSRFIYKEPATGGRRTAGSGTRAGAAPAALRRLRPYNNTWRRGTGAPAGAPLRRSPLCSLSGFSSFSRARRV